MSQSFPINIWINEERFEKLQQVGLGGMAKEVLAGMKVLQITCEEQQKNRLLELYPMAKFDSATTKSIELLPLDAKNRIFELILTGKSTTFPDEFFK